MLLLLLSVSVYVCVCGPTNSMYTLCTYTIQERLVTWFDLNRSEQKNSSLTQVERHLQAYMYFCHVTQEPAPATVALHYHTYNKNGVIVMFVLPLKSLDS